MEIRVIDKVSFLGLVYGNHYSIVMPRHTKYYLGCYEDGELVGGMSLGWGHTAEVDYTEVISHVRYY